MFEFHLSRLTRVLTAATILFAASFFFLGCGDDAVVPDEESSGALVANEDTAELADDIEQMESLGYLGGSAEARTDEGITVYREGVAWDGYNFAVSGPDQRAFIMGMDGEILHEWVYAQEDLLEAVGPPPEQLKAFIEKSGVTWRRAQVLGNGDLLAIVDQMALLKLDRESNLLWLVEGDFHHDLKVAADGTIYILGSEQREIPEVNAAEPVKDDLILVLDERGKESRRISLYDAMAKYYGEDLADRLPTKGDIFHTNTLELLDGSQAHRHPAFKKGNILLSMLMESEIAILDPDAEEIVWVHQGAFRYQHEPSLLANGNMLLFDNFGPVVGGSDEDSTPSQKQNTWYRYIFNEDLPENGASAVIEFNPLTGEEVWRYEGSASAPFMSETCGSTYRLPGGTTLVTETQYGRAFEVTRDGEIVWEFTSPFTYGNDKVAHLFDVQRLSKGEVDAWLSDISE